MYICGHATTTLYAVLACIHVAVLTGPEGRSVVQLSDLSDSTSSKVNTTHRREKSGRWSDGVQMGCKRLRSKRYISDGFCTSTKPITEAVCAGECLPIGDLPWYAEKTKYWARTKLSEWRCEENIVKRRRVKLLCENGETRTYKIKVVRNCKCKRYRRTHNRTGVRRGRKKRRKRRRRGRRRRGRLKLRPDL